MFYYSAYGLFLRSEIKLCLNETSVENDWSSVLIDSEFPLSLEISEQKLYSGDDWIAFKMNNAIEFYIEKGRHIAYHIVKEITREYFTSLVLGPCMGAILYSRGLLPLHASSLTDGSKTILIAGKSGAGKSTLTLQFLKEKWKILNDDISALEINLKRTIIRPGYPKIKIWNEDLSIIPANLYCSIAELYKQGGRIKYDIDVSDSFENSIKEPSLLFILSKESKKRDCIIVKNARDKADIIFGILYRRRIGEFYCNRTDILKLCYMIASQITVVLVPRIEKSLDISCKYDKLVRYINEI